MGNRSLSIDRMQRKPKGRRGTFIWAVLLLVVGLLAACGPRTARVPPPATATPPPPPSFALAPLAEAAPALIAAERQAARTGNLALLAQIWAEDATIVDGRGTPSPQDDYRWQGRDAILDRYVVAVFPHPPPPLTLPESLPIQADDGEATFQLGQDHWVLVQRDGRWWLYSLAYALGSEP